MLQNSNPIKKCEIKVSPQQDSYLTNTAQLSTSESKIEQNNESDKKQSKETNINRPNEKIFQQEKRETIQNKNIQKEGEYTDKQENHREEIKNSQMKKQLDDQREYQIKIGSQKIKLNSDCAATHQHSQKQISYSMKRNLEDKILIKIKNQKNIEKQNNELVLLENYGHVFRSGDIIVNSKKNILYKAIQLIGTGTFGQVLSVLCQTSNKSNSYKMAMKIVKKQPAYINQGLIQIKNLRDIAKYEQLTQGDRNGYLKLYDGFMWQGHLCIAMELLDNSILNILESSMYKGLEMKWIEKWSKQILFNLAKIHKMGIIHCDIKPQNIMFRPQQPEKPLLIDFSSSCTKGAQVFTYIQSRFYRSPEVLIGFKPYNQKIDIWSLGCLLAQMYLGLPLFPGGCAYDQIAKIYKLIGNRQEDSENSEVQMIQNSQFGKKFFQVIEKQSQTQKKQQVSSQINKQIKLNSLRLKSPKQYQKVNKNLQTNQDYFNLEQVTEFIQLRSPSPKDLQTHELFVDLLKKMLVFDPEQRISAQEAFLHPFIGGIFSELEQLRNLEEILEGRGNDF